MSQPLLPYRTAEMKCTTSVAELNAEITEGLPVKQVMPYLRIAAEGLPVTVSNQTIAEFSVFIGRRPKTLIETSKLNEDIPPDSGIIGYKHDRISVIVSPVMVEKFNQDTPGLAGKILPIRVQGQPAGCIPSFRLE